MKLKLMFGSIVLAMLSANTFATEIHHGKLLSHKEWAKGKIKGFVKEGALNNTTKSILQYRQLKAKKQDGDAIHVSDYVPSMTISPGTNEVFGMVNAFITNSTNASQTYTITSNLCVITFGNSNDADDQCFTTEDIVSLDAGGDIFLIKEPTMSYDFTDPNPMYVLVLISTVERSGIETVFSTADGQLIEFDSKK